MSNKPKISVCLITYNRAKYLGLAIDSVLAQTFTDWELIIIDNGSSDGSVEKIIKPYAAKDSRIKLYLNDDNRIAYSRNLALSKCSGKYVAVIDSDDIWADEGKLAKQYEFLEKNPDYVLIGGLGREIDRDGNAGKEINCLLSDELIRNKMLYYNNFIHSSVMFVREKAIKCGGYDESLVLGDEDYDLLLKLGTVGNMANLPIRLIDYRVYDGNINSPKIKAYLSIAKIKSRYKRYYPKYFYNLIKIIYFSVKHLFLSLFRRI